MIFVVSAHFGECLGVESGMCNRFPHWTFDGILCCFSKFPSPEFITTTTTTTEKGLGVLAKEWKIEETKEKQMKSGKTFV